MEDELKSLSDKIMDLESKLSLTNATVGNTYQLNCDMFDSKLDDSYLEPIDKKKTFDYKIEKSFVST